MVDPQHGKGSSMRHVFRFYAAIAAAILGLAPCSAVAITFNWENFGNGTATVPIYQLVDGMTATATGVGGNHSVVVITFNSGSFAGFGNHSIQHGANNDLLRL